MTRGLDWQVLRSLQVHSSMGRLQGTESQEHPTKHKKEQNMISSNLLQNIKLKKVETIDKSKPIITDGRQEIEYYEVIRTGHVDNWYHLIEEHTMKTVFIPLSFEQGQRIMAMHKQFLNNKEEFVWQESDLIQQFPDLHKQVIHAMENQLKNSQVFVKLSSRSPKDVQTGDFEQLMDQELSLLSEEELKDNHQRCRAIVRASCKLLKVNSFQQIMSLLIRSERVAEDLDQEIQLKPSSQFSISLVLREWVDIDFDLEFRGFVHQNRLNALSQYNHACYIDEIKENRDIILKRILQLFEIIQPKLSSIGSYVIDFTVNRELLFDESQLLKCVLVVELNPYEIGTGSCLFDWKTERDLFDNGPFEFRIIQSKEDIDLLKEMNPSYHKYLYSK